MQVHVGWFHLWKFVLYTYYISIPYQLLVYITINRCSKPLRLYTLLSDDYKVTLKSQLTQYLYLYREIYLKGFRNIFLNYMYYVGENAFLSCAYVVNIDIGGMHIF